MFTDKTKELRREMHAWQKEFDTKLRSEIAGMDQYIRELTQATITHRNERMAKITRDCALKLAMSTPGISGHEDVLKAAAAYEQYLKGEQPSPAH